MEEPPEEGMNMSVLRDDLGAVYVSNLAKLACGVEASRHPDDWLGYCMWL